MPNTWGISPQQSLMYGIEDLLEIMLDFRHTVSEIGAVYAAIATEEKKTLSNSETCTHCRV